MGLSIETTTGAPAPGRAVDAPVALHNPIRTRDDWEAQRAACAADPGAFHGRIARAELHWMAPDVGPNGAWLSWSDAEQCWIGFHALLETAEGVKNVESIAGASPRMHGLSLGPADLAASRGMKTTRVGGGHPHYGVLADAVEGSDTRSFAQQDLWHYTVAKMVDACVAHGIRAFYGPFGDLKDEAACEAQFRNAFLMGCSGAWSLAPNQIDIATRVFSPDVQEVRFAKRILDAMPDGSGVAMLDGKMQDDATWKQAKVMVDLARLVARRDPALADAYGLDAP